MLSSLSFSAKELMRTREGRTLQTAARQPHQPSAFRGNSRAALAWILLITSIAYLPVLRAGFINLDDALYVTALRDVSWRAVQQTFTTTFEGHYHPLTLISLGLNYRLGSGEAFPLHIVNLLIHLANTALVFYLARRLLKHPGHVAVVALVFGVHPVNSEAVCWITSRKDLQYALFYFAALLAYLAYIRHHQKRYFAAAMCFHMLSLLSKGMAVSLAPALLIMDYAQGRSVRSTRIWFEKTPFFLIALVSGAVTYLAQQSTGYLITGQFASWRALGMRIVYACYGLFLYAFNFVLPIRLSAHYPYPLGNGWSQVTVWATLLVMPALALGAVVAWRRRSRMVMVAIAFMLVNLGPMLKLVPVSDFIVADRYAYVASVGFGMLMATGIHGIVSCRLVRTSLVRLLFLGYVGALGLCTFSQGRIWQTSVGVWENVVRNYPDNVFALNMLGVAWAELGEYDDAITIYEHALEFNPQSARTYVNRGYAHYRSGRHAEAEADYTRAIMLDPESDTAYNNRGLVRLKRGDLDGALADLDTAIRLNPDYLTAFRAYHNRGEVRFALGDFDGARLDFDRAIALNPDFAPSRERLAAVLDARRDGDPHAESR